MFHSKPSHPDAADSSSQAERPLAKPEVVAQSKKLLRLVVPHGGLPAPAGDAQSGRHGGLAADDQDVLLSAIKARLRLAVGEPTATSMPTPLRRETAARVRANVLECVAALDRLHSMMGADAASSRQQKLDAFDAQAAIPHARAKLRGNGGAAGQGRRTGSADTLTLLPNRAQFRARLRQAFAQTEPQRLEFAVLTLDLDGFAPIQAELGSAAGDEVLGIVATRLARAIRSHDMVSRLRADEFGLFIASVASRDQLRRLVCKLFDAVVAPIAIDKRELSVRPNIGIAMSRADGASGAALIKSASAALGRARKQKTGYAFHDERGRAWVPGRV